MKRAFFAVILILTLSACAFAQEILSIKIADEVKTAGDSFALSQIAEISGPKAASRTAGWIRFSTDGTQLTRDEVVNALKQSKLEGIKIELRMPQVVKIDSRAQKNSPTIQKGRVIKIIANIDGIIVETQGEAMNNGSVGETIRVRNLSSKKIVSGIVRTSNSVEVRI